MIKVKPVVDGDCVGEAIVINDYISFFGEVDPRTGVHKPTGKSFSGKILIFRGGRGSTVGSYIIYGLKKYGKNPKCLIVAKAEPIIVAGAVLADIPLLVVENYDQLIKIVRDGVIVRHSRGEDFVQIE